ncbi:dnaJ homolog subfamily C member 24 [Myripristis murdjan]|uniref:DnaJ (Hsp40) homolog, subfamily C, member 24 n=1 Tax=Myripristis murdjan TaxID=586833 RepID=A0A667ZQD4_9TELE|nr:dnaJ homolog subfamily C member 24 [Myripristis murdjan]XP_029908569.1 dnaJ homolog subfamily C member 24 [Myripristis murdjan]XP_029908570.1 dnaJ homolog subfamily C member 24 [Myripristis murdjan]XP_029908572.1 dnaJ homolog subfamily C member 24 [Myripristis murdjan]XP_029908573.1 dnaJ homolog subfamily C member 24 [Myripristis murdjan]
MSQSAQKDLYAVLGASPSDSAQQLKHRYQQLVLQYHPDRLGGVCSSEAESGLRKFLEVDAAWKILKEHSSRKEYDLSRRAEELKQDWPVDSNVCLEDMSWDEDQSLYTHCCRCGGEFSITEEEVEEARQRTQQRDEEEEEDEEEHGVVVCCDTCSLSVYVTWTLQAKAPTLETQ